MEIRREMARDSGDVHGIGKLFYCHIAYKEVLRHWEAKDNGAAHIRATERGSPSYIQVASSCAI